MQISVAPSLAKLFGFRQKEAVAIMGSGGKTTLLWYLARAFRSEKILVTPTTKLFLPQQKYPQEYYDRLCDPAALALLSSLSPPPAPQHIPHHNGSHTVFHEVPAGITLAGITLAGCLHATAPPHTTASPWPPQAEGTANAVTQGMAEGEGMLPSGLKRREVADASAFAHKITPLDAGLLASQTGLFDKIFMECDGARNLPLKGWSSKEPVLPDFSTTVIAVMPLWAIGLTASDATIHRPELFYAMSQCRPGDTITLEHLARIITHISTHVITHHQGLVAQKGMRSKESSDNKARFVLFLHSPDEDEPENSLSGKRVHPQNTPGQNTPEENTSGENTPKKNNSVKNATDANATNQNNPHLSNHTAHQLVSLLPREVLVKTSRIITGSARTGWGKLLWPQSL